MVRFPSAFSRLTSIETSRRAFVDSLVVNAPDCQANFLQVCLTLIMSPSLMQPRDCYHRSNFHIELFHELWTYD